MVRYIIPMLIVITMPLNAQETLGAGCSFTVPRGDDLRTPSDNAMREALSRNCQRGQPLQLSNPHNSESFPNLIARFCDLRYPAHVFRFESSSSPGGNMVCIFGGQRPSPR